jgi:hypothetical protein
MPLKIDKIDILFHRENWTVNAYSIKKWTSQIFVPGQMGRLRRKKQPHGNWEAVFYWRIMDVNP